MAIAEIGSPYKPLKIIHLEPCGGRQKSRNKMDEEQLKQLSELGLSEEDLKDPAKVKEAAEKIEAENKSTKEESGGDDENAKILNDQLGRLAKALEKQASIKGKKEEPAKKEEEVEKRETLSELDVDNRVFARSEKLSEKQIEILREYSKLPKNEGKSFEDISKSSAVQAEFKELQAELDAAEEIDANADEKKTLETKNEIYEKHSKTGDTPDTEHEHKIVAEKALEEEGYREY